MSLESAAREVVAGWRNLLLFDNPTVVRTPEETESARVRLDFAVSRLAEALEQDRANDG